MASTSQASLLLQKQLKDLCKNPIDGFWAGLVDENNLFEWSVTIIGPPDALYAEGFFNAIMTFPQNYPNSPPSMRFTSEIWHPNVYSDGKVCISILHPPGDDPHGYELASERWTPVHTKEWRERRDDFRKKDEIVRANKNACNNWLVYPISKSRFKVKSSNHVGVIVDFQQQTCTCRKWQIDGIPCGHVIKVLTSNNYEDCSQYAIAAYYTETLRKTYEECVNPLPSPADWEIPGDLIFVRPPILVRRQPGKPKNTDRIPSQGEVPIRKECSTCGHVGHTRNNCTGGASGSGSRQKKKSTRQGRMHNESASGSGSQSENVYGSFDFNSTFDLNVP